MTLKNDAKRHQKGLRELAMAGSGSKTSISDVRAGKATVHTSSHFHDPRLTIGLAIEEALDPALAPKTLRNECFQTERVRVTGPETEAILERLNKVWARKYAIRAAVKRAQTKHAPKTMDYAVRGITSEFAEEVKEPYRRPWAEESARALKFLSTWLSSGSAVKKDILRDARREEITAPALKYARLKLDVYHQGGRWFVGPRPAPAKPFGVFEYTTEFFLLKFPMFLRMIEEAKSTTVEQLVEVCRDFETRAGSLTPGTIMGSSDLGRTIHFVKRPDELPLIWVRNPGALLDAAAHLEERDGQFELVGAGQVYRKRLMALGGKFVTDGCWRFLTRETAERGMAKIVDARRRQLEDRYEDPFLYLEAAALQYMICGRSVPKDSPWW